MKKKNVMSQMQRILVKKFPLFKGSRDLHDDATKCYREWMEFCSRFLSKGVKTEQEAIPTCTEKFLTKCESRHDGFLPARLFAMNEFFSKRLPVVLVVASLIIALIHVEFGVCPCVLI